MTENQTCAPEGAAPARESIYAALAKAQAEFPSIGATKVASIGKSGTYKYADLQDILRAIKPVLAKYGLFVWQPVSSTKSDVTVRTIVAHASGETLESDALTIPAGGSLSPAQSIGSALSYARRYSLCATLGIAVGEDDDGASVTTPQEQTPAFVLTRAMVDEAQRAAKGGVEAYKRYYQARPEQERTELAKTGWHKQCYESAKAADAARSAS